ncbi:MAG: zinc-dependent metalloprotease [Gammaproteobacteria bacterium]|nr:zinc-dependent metalloprotease [Gammaproteobacteria bacterium]
MKLQIQTYLVLFFLLITAFSVSSQETDESTDIPETIAEVTENSDRISGLFTLYRDKKTGTTHMEIAPTQLNREYIYVAVSTDGVVEGGHFRGRYRDNRILSLTRYFDKIEIRSQNTSFYFDPESPLSRAAHANISPGLLASETIVAEDEETGNVLINIDEIFATETLLQVKPSPNPNEGSEDNFQLGDLSEEKSKITHIRNYPLNTDVHVEYVYQNPAPIVRGNDEITDSRYVSIYMQHSFVAMPENNYAPRLTDHRMGFFAQQLTDLTDDSVTPFRDLVERWHLVKKNPSLPTSEPISPIVWWIENTTPIEFRDSIQEGILAWNQAFEKIGFENAIVVQVQPDDAEWDAGDIRYNVVRWTSSPTPPFSGYGPSFTNPRTGQIIGADIMLEFAGVTRRVQYQRILENLENGDIFEPLEAGYCSIGYEKHISQAFGRFAINSLQLGSAQEEQLVHEFLVDLTMHEIGHTLGFAHNFAASNMLSFEEIYDSTIVNERSLQASVMDYTDIHIATEGREQIAYFSTKPGPYDDWIVDYSYSSGLEDPQLENERLALIASRSTEPQLLFGTDDHVMRAPGVAMDPRVHWYDMTNEPIRYAEERLDLIGNLLSTAKEKNINEGESYQELRDAYVIMLSQFSRSIGVIAHQIGAIYINRSVVGQDDAQTPFIPVDIETQQYAMSVLTEHLFAPNVLSASEDLYAHLQEQRRLWNFFGQTEDPKIHQWILSLQSNILAHLLHPRVMTRITDSRLYGNQYELSDMMSDLTDGIFDEDLRGNVNTFRQNLQTEYISKLINIIESSEHDYPSKSMALYQIRNIERMLNNKRRGNIETRAHTGNILYLIQKALDQEA